MKKLIMFLVASVCLSGFTLAQSLTLTWTNSETEGVTGYNMYRSESAGSGYAQVNGSLIPTDPSGFGEWADDTVKYNKRYYYVCRAALPYEDPAGDSGILESVNSNEATEYIMPPAPNAPYGLIKKSSTP